jgi:hypothetical protein
VGGKAERMMEELDSPPVYRFVVTRIGFLRSVKKLMELSKHHVTIVDPSTGERRETIRYEEIDEIQLPSASSSSSSYSFPSAIISNPLAVDPENQEQEERFTVVTATSKETYSCFRRLRFLSCYFELREEHLKARRLLHGAALAMEPSRSAYSALALFSLSHAVKWCSRGQCRVPTRLVVRATCLDEEEASDFTGHITDGETSSVLDPNGEGIVGSGRRLPTLYEKQRIWFIDIVKIQRIVNDPSTLVLYMSDGSVKRYWAISRGLFNGASAGSPDAVNTSNGSTLQTTDSAELAGALVSNARQCLNMHIHAETSDGPWEYEALTATVDEVVVPVVFEMPVCFEEAASLGVREDYKNGPRDHDDDDPWHSAHAPATPILLALTATAILERDPHTKRTISSSQLSDVFSIVRDRQSESIVIVELLNGMSRRYRCVDCLVVERSQDVGVGFGPLSPRCVGNSEMEVGHLHDTLLQSMQAQHNAHPGAAAVVPGVAIGDGPSPGTASSHKQSIPIVGSMEPLSASCARDVLISNILDQALLSKRRIPLYFRETGSAIRVGGRSAPTSQIAEYLELLLKRVCSFSFKDTTSMSRSLEDLLLEVVVNIPESGFHHNNRAAVRQMFSMIAVSHQKPTFFPVAILLLALQALRRLLFSRHGFEEVSRSENGEGMVAVVHHLERHPDDGVAYECACLLKCMVSQAGLDPQSKALARTMRQEDVNRKALFLHADGLVAVLTKCALEGRPGPRAATTTMTTVTAGRLHLGVAVECQDALVTFPLLQMLEMTLSSKKNSDAKVKNVLLSALGIHSSHNQKQLFALCRSVSFPIGRAATLLLKTHVLEESPQLMLQLQDHCRESGILLWHLYLAIDAASPIQRHCSSQLVALLVHENPRSRYISFFLSFSPVYFFLSFFLTGGISFFLSFLAKSYACAFRPL